jgi:hypothetical protein
MVALVPGERAGEAVAHLEARGVPAWVAGAVVESDGIELAGRAAPRGS